MLLGFTGFAFMANYLAVYLAIPMCYLGLRSIIWLEERELERRFGDAYRRYRAGTPMLVPRPRG